MTHILTQDATHYTVYTLPLLIQRIYAYALRPSPAPTHPVSEQDEKGQAVPQIRLIIDNYYGIINPKPLLLLVIINS